MFAICVESSHQCGMGHLFRAMNLIKFLEKKNEPFVVCINDNATALSLLKKRRIRFEIVDINDTTSNWEQEIIKRCKIDIWINDRLNTAVSHAKHVVQNGIKLVTFDDRGSGAIMAHLHVAALIFNNNTNLKGDKVVTGIDYLILDDEIRKHRRIRKGADKILVTLGGSDTYGVSIKVVEWLKDIDRGATIITGPSFNHKKALMDVVDDRFIVREAVPSLIETFRNFDLAITGGGITPFEANASGLPCIVIANEIFEVQNGRFLDALGSSIYAGRYSEVDFCIFGQTIPIEKMSRIGMERIKLNGVEHVYREIKKLG